MFAAHLLLTLLPRVMDTVPGTRTRYSINNADFTTEPSWHHDRYCTYHHASCVSYRTVPARNHAPTHFPDLGGWWNPKKRTTVSYTHAPLSRWRCSIKKSQSCVMLGTNTSNIPFFIIKYIPVPTATTLLSQSQSQSQQHWQSPISPENGDGAGLEHLRLDNVPCWNCKNQKWKQKLLYFTHMF